MKVAIVHDWLANMGGAERVILAFKEIFPEAPIYTVVYNPDKIPKIFHDMDVRPSFIQKLPKAKTKYQMYLPLMPTAVEQFDLSGFDVVLSSSSSVAKGVITKAGTVHICYCHTPMRYAWDFYHEYLQGEDVGPIKRKLIPWLMNYIRMWDRLSADRVDYFIANSHNVATRIRKHYRREAAVIHPPVNGHYFTPEDTDGGYFLVVSRLVPYKRVDLAVKACNELGLPLKIIGGGSELERLKALAGPTVQFMGRLTDEEIRKAYADCKAFIFPAEEDFGITPLEAQASGRPVIAYGVGGALETVVPGKTGLFFDSQTVESLTKAVESFNSIEYNKGAIREHALNFDVAVFKEKIKNFVEEKFEEHRRR